MANMVQLPFNRQYENFRRMPAYPAGGQVPQGLTRGPAIQSAGQSTVVINSMHQFTYANGDFLSMFVGATTNEPAPTMVIGKVMSVEPGGGYVGNGPAGPYQRVRDREDAGQGVDETQRDVGFHEICKTDFYLDQN
ncbi:hypothetical protein B0H14DRAFT_2597552 [Mycena olivaceomarginata]|nr:hypothetical protein B0H14DRAFT_2597552 [Mycena olivaceomarginata]